VARALETCLLSDHYRPGVRLGYRPSVAIDPSRKSSTPFAVTYEAATLPSGRAKLLSSG
jgi:hypothetical protein